MREIDLSSPSSGLSSQLGINILPTPPVLEDASSRNSIPTSGGGHYGISLGGGAVQTTESFTSSGISGLIGGG